MVIRRVKESPHSADAVLIPPRPSPQPGGSWDWDRQRCLYTSTSTTEEERQLRLAVLVRVEMSRSILPIGHSLTRTALLRFSPSPLPLPLQRHLSTSPRRLLATPQTGPQTVQSQPSRSPHPIDTSTKTAADSGSRHPGETSPSASPATQWPDYSKGPSALDKASQLFFFTEIVRGELLSIPSDQNRDGGRVVEGRGERGTGTGLTDRNVDCVGTVFPTALHHHVPVRERPFVSSVPWRARSPPIPQRRGKMYRYVPPMVH